MSNCARALAAAGLLGLITSGAAEAAAVRVGAGVMATAAVTRGTAVAYDHVNKVYLVVGAHGALNGRFVGADGTPLGAQFAIQTTVNFASFPRVAFSPDADGGAGAFLVTWNQDGLPSTVQARLVSYTKNGPLGASATVGTAPFFESSPAVAYSSISKEFLVVFKNIVTNDINASRVSIAGALIAGVALPATPDGERDPSVAYNPDDDQFLVAYSGYNNRYAFVAARRIQAGTGAVIDSGDRLEISQTGGTYITETTYNTRLHEYFVSWYALPAAASLGQRMARSGALTGSAIALSTRWKGYDALGVAYNSISDTFFLVSHNTTGTTPNEDGGVELKSDGTPVDNGFVVTANGAKNGNFYPKITAATDRPDWLMSSALDFGGAATQRIVGTTSDTGPTPTPTPTPQPPVTPVPNPKMNADYPARNSTVAANAFLVAGWAIDQGALEGTGVDVVQVWAFPVGSTTGQFVGTATYGVARPDVAAYVGARFTNCGYALVGSLPAPGAYNLYVFAHSTVTGTFNNVAIVPVTIAAPSSNPKMWLDVPANNATVAQGFIVAGWALDLGSSSGTGVDTVHVWAYPTVGSAIPVGVAQYGASRPDVGNFAGHSRFAGSGFRIDGTLPVGDYTIVAFAHSTVTNTFNNVATAVIHVR